MSSLSSSDDIILVSPRYAGRKCVLFLVLLRLFFCFSLGYVKLNVDLRYTDFPTKLKRAYRLPTEKQVVLIEKRNTFLLRVFQKPFLITK